MRVSIEKVRYGGIKLPIRLRFDAKIKRGART